MPYKDPEARKEYAKKWRANMTPEQKERDRKCAKRWYQNRTPEQKEAQREKDRERKRIANMTSEQIAKFQFIFLG